MSKPRYVMTMNPLPDSDIRKGRWYKLRHDMTIKTGWFSTCHIRLKNCSYIGGQDWTVLNDKP